LDTHTQALWNEWLQIKSDAELALESYVGDYFHLAGITTCDRAVIDALTFARLGEKDELIFDHLVYLMETYREVIGLFEETAEENGWDDTCPVYNLISGLCDVLGSRMRQFEDVAEGHENPVAQEKRLLLDNMILEINGSIEGIKTEWVTTLPWEKTCADIFLLPDENTKHLRDSINNNLIPLIYNLYQSSLSQCITQIDDLYSRKAAHFYADLLEREWEVLGLVIQIQVQALENAAFNENGLLHPILSRLREVYQQTGPVIGNLQAMMQAEPYTPHGMPYGDFCDAMHPHIGVFTGIDMRDPMYKEMLFLGADELFDRIRADVLENMYGFRVIIDRELKLASGVLDTFNAIMCNFPACDAEEVKSKELEILKGITETLEIKIDSLTESLQPYSEACEGLSTSFSTNMPTLSDEDLFAAADQITEAWYQSPPSTMDEIDDFFTGCLTLDVFNAYKSQLDKHIEGHNAKLDKTAFNFKKETLLFEISTFEEILYHSVSRLRESGHDAIIGAVAVLDGLSAALMDILMQNNIEIIHPAPHEAFNGREHEVLLAEPHEGYAKGEIVKVMTSGYKYQSQVILRANVIAAR